MRRPNKKGRGPLGNKLLQDMTEPELGAHLSYQLRFIESCHTPDTIGSMLIIFQQDGITQ